MGFVTYGLRAKTQLTVPTGGKNQNTVLCIGIATYYKLSWVVQKGSVTYGLGADNCLPHWLATGIWTLCHPKSDHRAEISGEHCLARRSCAASRGTVSQTLLHNPVLRVFSLHVRKCHAGNCHVDCWCGLYFKNPPFSGPPQTTYTPRSSLKLGIGNNRHHLLLLSLKLKRIIFSFLCRIKKHWGK